MHIREFLRWKGGRPISEELLLKWIHHSRAIYRGSTAAVKWQAIKWYYIQSREQDEWDQKTAVKSCAWVGFISGFFDRNSNRTMRIGDSECRAIFDAGTRRQKAFILGIRAGDLRISELLRLRPHDQRLPRRVWVYLTSVFGGEEWLLETQNGRQYHRSYISNQLAKLSMRVVGRAHRPENFRPPENSTRERFLLGEGDESA